MKNRIVLICALLLSPVVAFATVTGTATSASFVCSNSTGPFPFTFPIDTAAAMTVTQNGAVLASSAYTISPVNNSYGNGGSVTLNTACPSGQTLVLQRITPITQLTQFTPYMPALYANIEDGLDQLTEIDQELYADYTTIKPACGTVPIGTPCGGTGATTPAAGLANLGGFPITGGALTGPLTAPSVTTGLLNNIVAIPACGGVDDTAAITTAFSAAYFNNVVMFPAHSTCVYSGVWSVSTGVQYDLNGSTIKMTGTGGGTCSEGVNGLLQFTGSGFINAVIHNGTLEAMNASAGCIVNIGAAGAGFANRIEVKNINFSTASGVTLPQAIYVSNAGNFYIHDNIFTSSFNYDIDSPDAAAQNNGFEISGNNFQTLNTISNYQVNLTNAQTGHIHDNVFESGPNGIKANGVINGLDIGSNWFGDPSGVGTSIYTGTSGSAVHIHDNFIYSSGTGSVGIQDNSQESTVENNYITLADTCISTNSAAPQVTVIGNNCYSFGSTGLKANAPNMVIQNNLWSGLNASSIGVDSEAQNQTIGPNRYYVPGSGSVTINCGSTYDILMEPGANVPTACKTLSLHNTSLAPGNAAIFPDGITTTSCVGCGGGGTVNSAAANQLAYYASTGTAVSGTNALPAGTTAATQTAGDNTTKVATTAYVASPGAITPSTVAAGASVSGPLYCIGSSCITAWPTLGASTTGLTGAVSEVQLGAAAQNVIAVIGDSWTAGQTITDGLATLAMGQSGNAGNGYVSLCSVDSPPGYTTITPAGTWVVKNMNTDSTAFGVDGYDCTSSDTSTPASYAVLSSNVTSFTIHYKKQLGGGSFDWSIDGGSYTTVSTSNASDLYATLTVSAGAFGTHTVHLRVSAAGTSGVTLMGVEAVNTNGGARVQIVGDSGATSGGYAALRAAPWEAGLTALNPQTVVVMLGVNDMVQSVVPATTAANMNTIIQRVQAALPNAAVYIATQTDSGYTGETYPLSAYVSAEQGLASSTVGFINTFAMVGPFNGNAYGLYLDSFHPNGYGGQMIASLIGAQLFRFTPLIPRNANGSVEIKQLNYSPGLIVDGIGNPQLEVTDGNVTLVSQVPSGAAFGLIGVTSAHDLYLYAQGHNVAQINATSLSFSGNGGAGNPAIVATDNTTHAQLQVPTGNGYGIVGTPDPAGFGLSTNNIRRIFCTSAGLCGVGGNLSPTWILSGTSNLWGVDSGGVEHVSQTIPVTIYSAAGTVLPTCNSGANGATAIVSDATTPTYHGAYASGGAITSQVICSYSGSSYSWLTQ